MCQTKSLPSQPSISSSEDVSKATKSVLQSTQNITKEEKSTELLDLPEELLDCILRFCRPNTKSIHIADVLLGLTCAKLYRIMKHYRPYPIAYTGGEWNYCEDQVDWYSELELHIGGFLGPGYRRCRGVTYGGDPNCAFISCAVYGDGTKFNYRERVLIGKWELWKMIKRYGVKTLPSPFGLGDMWIDLLIEELVKHKKEWEISGSEFFRLVFR